MSFFNLSFSLRPDPVGWFFLALFSVEWVAAGIYAKPYVRHDGTASVFFPFYLLAGVLMGLIALSGNLFTFLLFFEGMALSMTPLVALGKGVSGRGAAMSFLGYSIFGAALVLFGLFSLSGLGVSADFTKAGTLAGYTGDKGWLVTLYFIMALGFSVKAGMLPFHAWLPIAHPIAPSPASAVLSGAVTKCGVLGILRLTYELFGVSLLSGSWAQKALLVLAVATIFTGSMKAFTEPQIKRRLAYSTVSQVSYALFGLLLMTESGLRGALYQVFFHGLAKCSLFLFAGAAIYVTGRDQVGGLRGIGRRMPAACWTLVLGALSLVGIPPLAGFVSKFALANAALAAPLAGYGLAGLVVIMVSALLTAGYLFPMMAAAFFPGKDFVSPDGWREPPKLMLVGMLSLSALLVILGVYPTPIARATDAILAMLF